VVNERRRDSEILSFVERFSSDVLGLQVLLDALPLLALGSMSRVANSLTIRIASYSVTLILSALRCRNAGSSDDIVWVVSHLFPFYSKD
jgi:hypothetical protein